MTCNIRFRFYEELNDFLPDQCRKRAFQTSHGCGAMLGEVIEEIGVPLEQIDLILVNGVSEDFDYALRDGDRVSVFPVFERLDISGVARLPDRPLRKLRFLVDNGLEPLAGRMKELGMDVSTSTQDSLRGIVDRSEAEGRTILTSRRELLEAGGVTRGLLVEGTDPGRQLEWLLTSLHVTHPAHGDPDGSIRGNEKRTGKRRCYIEEQSAEVREEPRLFR
jgi:molybdopterin converting factor small subunit